MQEFLEYVVKGLVQNPDAVTVTPVERAGTTVYELRLDPRRCGQDHRPAGHDDQRDPLVACWPAARRRVCAARWKLSKTKHDALVELSAFANEATR